MLLKTKGVDLIIRIAMKNCREEWYDPEQKVAVTIVDVTEAAQALAVLGYSSAEIAPALKKIDATGMSAEEIIKAVLKQMVK